MLGHMVAGEKGVSKKPHPETNSLDTYLSSHAPVFRDTTHHICPSAHIYVYIQSPPPAQRLLSTVSAVAVFVLRVFLFRFSF